MVLSTEQPSIWGKLVVVGGGNLPKQQQQQVVELDVLVDGLLISKVPVGQEDWHVQLPPQAPGTGHTVQIKVERVGNSSLSIRLIDVAFGDVFLCSGQSNMEMSVYGAFNASEEMIDSAQYPELRMFTAAENKSTVPEWDIHSKAPNGSWLVSGPDASSNGPFAYPSAVCYFTGRDIFVALRSFNRTASNGVIPIGLVTTAWGGQPIEYFSSPSALAKCTAPATNNGSCIWNGMVSVFTKFHFRAALWYQGEANSHDPDLYSCRFPAMIADWRNHFLGSTLPFYYVQLAPYTTEDYSLIRAAQDAALQLPGVYATSTIDLGDPTSPFGSIHPRRKQEVGRRLAMNILVHEYGYSPLSIKGEHPYVKSVEFKNDTITLKVQAHRNLHWQGTAACSECCFELPFTFLDQFSGNWSRVTSHTTTGHTIELIAPNAVGLRYAWEGYPQCVLYDGLGGPDDHRSIPLSPFEWCLFPTGKPSWSGDGCGLMELRLPLLPRGQNAVASSR